MKNFLLLLAGTIVAFTLSCGGCGSSSSDYHYSSSGSTSKEWTKKPVDEFVRDFYKEKTFSIILHDMFVEDNTFTNKYFHQYRIIREKDTLLPFLDTTNIAIDSNSVINEDSLVLTSIPYDTITGKMQVPEKYFRAHENDMGMTICWKTADGKVHKDKAAPPSYNSSYVGNRRYGHWNGGFWQWYGQYMFFSTMFRPTYYSDYSYYRSNYYNTGRSYYGRDQYGKQAYGTNSSYAKKSNPSFFDRKAKSTGWNRSNSTYRSSGSSRYGGSSGRSSGSGFGK